MLSGRSNIPRENCICSPICSSTKKPAASLIQASFRSAGADGQATRLAAGPALGDGASGFLREGPRQSSTEEAAASALTRARPPGRPGNCIKNRAVLWGCQGRRGFLMFMNDQRPMAPLPKEGSAASPVVCLPALAGAPLPEAGSAPDFVVCLPALAGVYRVRKQ